MLRDIGSIPGSAADSLGEPGQVTSLSMHPFSLYKMKIMILVQLLLKSTRVYPLISATVGLGSETLP